jgi:nitrate/TMAO reductase-like tetraheme cytochrome c subunit
LGADTSKLTQVLCWLLICVWLPATSQAYPPQRETSRSPHGPLAIPCENCHNAASWRPIRAVPEFDHNKTKYPLRGMHEKVACAQCHSKPVFTDVGKNCQDCHADIHQRKMGTNCAQCHTVQGWNIAVQQVKDHQNRFPLFGAHAAVQCDDCHKSAAVGQFQGLSTACASCHLKDFQKTTNPNHVSAQFSTTCESCHSFDSWLGAKFDHNATGFPLTFGHANVACQLCHINNNYNLQIAPTDCGNSQCHLTTWQQTNNPVHSAAGPAFGLANCSNCHTTKGWDAANFDHTSTGFLLTNGHATVPCASCHVNNNYNLQIAPTDCGNSGCHLSTWQQTNNPTHSTSGLAFAVTNCSNCHTTKGWDGASFDHSTTGFTLTGTHASPTPTPCLSCHVSNNYTLNSADCMGCHQSAWNSTPTFGGSVPNHITAGFPTTASACATCHPITKWADGKFDHNAFGFPLTNSHALVANGGKVPACISCHINNNYNLQIAPTDCGNSGCHLTTWQQTNNPVHPSAGAPFAAANCSTCHNTITWNTAIFDHSATGWALTGSHQLAPAGKAVACTDCHVGNNYTFTSANTDCYGCHQTAWNSTPSFGGSVPNHITAGFPTTLCSSCHDTITWTDSTFNHASTGFPLTNSHQLAPAGKVTSCASCHINNNYSLTISPTDCGNSQCHLTTWQTTNNPVHPAAGAPFAAANCSTCHNTITWTTAIFDHSATGWALTGSHQLAPAGKVVACTDCHIGNNYTFTSANTDCYGCHQPAWISTQTLGGAVPNHVTAGFPTSQCSTCHDTLLWADGKFDHSTTGWPLQGAHVTTPCSSCHIGASPYSLTSANTDCYGCHQAAWQSTVTLGGAVPNHVAAQYPTTCITCHTTWVTTGWLGATFNHTWFRIPHNGSVCSDCHLVSTDYSSFSCINCHTRTAHQPGMSHPQVSGYSYGATTCYNCHKQ